MTTQFALDLEDLEINGDTADVSADAPFLTINNGILKLVATAAVRGPQHRRLDDQRGRLRQGPLLRGALRDAERLPQLGQPALDHRPAAADPAGGRSITDRATASGDAALLGQGGALDPAARHPVPRGPGDARQTVLLPTRATSCGSISWQVRKRKVTGETDAELAAKDKRFYVFFIKHDIIIEETDAVVRVHTLDAI